MNSHTFQVLEFNRLKEYLCFFAASEGGKRLCLNLQPSTILSEVQNRLNETSEMFDVINLHGALPLSDIHDISDSIARARIQNAFLESKTLLLICETIEAAARLKKYFSPCMETAPSLWRISDGVLPLDHISDRIRKCVGPQGEILDTASDTLIEIRRNINSLRRSIINSLEDLLDNDQKAFAIQDDYITIRNNRYVIPVRSDSKTAVPGVVHDQSQSKATFFVEPLQIVEMNNQLQILRREEYYEEIKILTELTTLISKDADAVLHNCRIAESLDLIHARALFSKALNASPARLSTDRSITVRQCRHPLLLARFVPPENDDSEGLTRAGRGSWVFDRPGVIPVDIVKTQSVSSLVITGANAGGKTVAMKTLGLFVLMTQAGMHIPAAPSASLPLFEQVFADIGDEQNIESNVSTFSSHMRRISDIVTQAGPSSLVLLDELGSGTDPSEGGALAVAILDFLRRRKCCTVVTTHLNILKTYAYANTDVENVSVAFDPVSHKPLYSLVYGMPGFSNAFAIARSIGMPEEILSAAHAALSGSDHQIAELIRGLEQNNREFLSLKNRFRILLEDAARHEEVLHRLVETLKQQRNSLLKSFETASKKLLRESESALDKIIREQRRRTIIRPDEDFSTAQASKEKFQNIKRTLHERFATPPAPPPPPVEHLVPGQRVYLIHLKKQGTVTSADNASHTAEVSVGALRVKAGFRDLSLADSTAEQQSRPRASAAPASLPVAAEPSRINVIGMRVDEALPLVDKAIDGALLQGAQILEVIHGRGTGRLMQAIHEHLKNHCCVCRYDFAPPSSGGSGVTVVHIK